MRIKVCSAIVRFYQEFLPGNLPAWFWLVVKVSGAGSYALQTFPSDRKKIDRGDYYSNFDKIRSMLGWEPKVPLAEGLARTVAFYRQHIAQYL